MSEHDFDPWKTSTGLVDEYTGTIVDAQFGFKPEYQNGTRLLLMLDINTGDPSIGEGGIASEQYPVGDGWDTHDGGKTAVHSSGQDKNFNNASGIGLLLNSIIDAGGLGVLQATGVTPDHAACWIGGRYNFERKQFESKMNDGKEVKWNRMLVVSLAPEGGAATPAPAPAAAPVAAPAASAPAAAAAPAPAPVAGAGGADHAIPVTTKAKLKTIALASDTHDAFVEKAFTDLPESMDGGPIEAAVGDPAFYAALKG